jgi:2-dehydro-3-deoxy-D-gluconate 5-dehydrogenase
MSLELFSLAGRVALITGGNGGIGRAMALGMQKAGARVAVTGRNAAKNREVAEALGEDGAVFALDVREEQAVQQVIAQVVERFGRLDILINNAGIARRSTIVNMPLENWNAVIETHLTGSFLCSKHAAQAMIARGAGGKLINIGSMYSIYGGAGLSNYGAAKTGIVGLTRALAGELAVHQIQVNAILPGWYETELTQNISDSWREQIRRKTPAGRWGTGADLVGAAVFLASAASDFVTGACLPVDGGYAISDRFIDA